MKHLIALALIKCCIGAALVEKKAICSDFCTENYSPVCGSNGVTYSNICFFQSAQCHDNSITLVHKGDCGNHVTPQPCPDAMCFALYMPVCGTDGKTYSNECELKGAHCHGDVTVAHTGACNDLIVS